MSQFWILKLKKISKSQGHILLNQEIRGTNLPYKSASPDVNRRLIEMSRQGLMQLTRYVVLSPLDAEEISFSENISINILGYLLFIQFYKYN